jgi:hypothetical protein
MSKIISARRLLGMVNVLEIHLARKGPKLFECAVTDRAIYFEEPCCKATLPAL